MRDRVVAVLETSKSAPWRVGLLLVGLATCLACSGNGAASGAAPGLKGSVAELQRGLPVGHAGEWYGTRLEELGYETGSVEYGESSVAYRATRSGRTFRVQVEIDPETREASQVRIAALDEAPGGATGADLVAENGAASEEAPGQTAAPPPPPGQGHSPATGDAERVPEPAPVAVVDLPAGTRIPARLEDRLDSGSSRQGDPFTMTVAEPIRASDALVIPAGSIVHGVVAEAEGARRPNKGGRLLLRAVAVELDSGVFDLEGVVTAPGHELKGQDSTREDLEEIAIGAGVGGVLGGLLGGGKGVLAGILIGGGGTFVATKGEQVTLPGDTLLEIELRRDARIEIR